MTGAAYTDEEWINRFRNGEEAAYRHFFDRHYGAIVHYAQSILQQGAEAEDIAQDIFYQLWQHRAELNSTDHVKGFLYKSTRFACINQLRQWQTRDRNAEVLLRQATNDPFTESRMVQEELYQLVIAEINALPEKYAAILRLRYLQDMGYDQIAAQLGTNEATVRKQKQRALEMLQTAVVKNKLLTAAALLSLLHELHR